MTRRSRATLAGGVAAMAVLTACAGEPGTEPDPTHTTAVTECCAGLPQSGNLTVGRPVPPARPTVVPEPVVPGDTPVDSPPELPRLTAVDLVSEGGHDEIVYSFEGAGIVGWSLRAVSEVIPYGGVTVAPVAGGSTVQVDLTGVVGGDQPRRHVDPTLGVVVEVIELPVPDSIVQSFVGLRTGGAAVAVREHATDGGSQLIVSVTDH